MKNLECGSKLESDRTEPDGSQLKERFMNKVCYYGNANTHHFRLVALDSLEHALWHCIHLLLCWAYDHLHPTFF